MDKKGNEIAVIKAFKNGDSKGFEKLFELHHKKLYFFLFRMLKSKEDAEEIVQDSFIKIWERREDFIEGHPFEAFLYKIAKNAFLNHNRKKINRKVFEDHLTILNEMSSNNTEEYIIFNETREIINTIINSLPPKRKEIYLLQKNEGLSRQEIAEKLGISVITVDSQLLKANKFLKEELKHFSLMILIFFLN